MFFFIIEICCILFLIKTQVMENILTLVDLIFQIEDPHFIARLCLLALLTISTIAGICFLCVDTLMAQTRPALLRL